MTLRQKFSIVLLGGIIGFLSPTQAADYSSLWQSAEQEKTPFLETLKQLVNIESGSTDLEGLGRISTLIADRLSKLGGTVVVIDPSDQSYRMSDTPEKIGKIVRADWQRKGIAHRSYGHGIQNKKGATGQAAVSDQRQSSLWFGYRRR